MDRETPLRRALEDAGARMGAWFGTLLPANFGDSTAEYRCARGSAAAVDTNFQLVAELRGPDRVRYLNATTSGNILALQPGQSTMGLLLNPQGHMLAELRTLALESSFLLFTPAMVGERTLATLDKFIIMDDVELIDRSAEFGALAVIGPAAEAAAESVAGQNLAAVAAGGHLEAAAGVVPCRVLRATSLRLPGFEFFVERRYLPALWRELVDAARRHQGGVAGYETVNVLRLESGVPWFGADFDDRVIPHEAGLESSHISYTKGCYTGQEIVERVRSRGQANRRLLPLSFSGETVPQPGAKLTADGKEAGWVTSAAFSPAAGRPIGLGYLRREFHAPGARLEWQRGDAQVATLPFAPESREQA